MAEPQQKRKRIQNQSFQEWYYQLQPGTGPRTVFVKFEQQNPLENNVITRLINKQTEFRPPTSYTSGFIDVGPDCIFGFQSMDPDYQLMMSPKRFICQNTPRNINISLYNTYFWVQDNWDGSTTPLGSATMWNKTWRKVNITPGYYPDQLTLTTEMKQQDAAVSFSFNNATNLLTYNGTKPILLPLTRNFDPDFYKNRPAVAVTNTFNAVPTNKTAGVITNASTTVWDNTVNGASVPWKYLDPEFRLDTLANKLGFFGGSPDSNIQYYFTYPILSDFPNVSTESVTTPLLTGQEGVISVILYPGAKSGPGNMYGAHAIMNITSPQLATALPNQNVLLEVDVASQASYSTFQETGEQVWMPVAQPFALNKRFEFYLRDLYNRPYELNAGIPSLCVQFEPRIST